MTTTVGTSVTYSGQPINSGTFTNFTATTTGTIVKSGSGVLFGLTFNNPVATGVVTLYDGLTTGGAPIATITVPSSPQPFTWGIHAGGIFFNTGLFIVIATENMDITVVYR